MKRRRPLVTGGTGRVVRALPVQVRTLVTEANEDTGEFDAVVLRYNVRDDYNTEFAPGTFDASLAQRMPRIAWGHDWRDIVGQWTAYESTGEVLRLRGKLDLAMIEGGGPAVPRAWQAWAQLKSGTADQFSVGFVPEAWEDVQLDDDWYRRFTRGRLDEVSIVLAGAVPGTELLAVRSGIKLHVREPLVSKEQVAGLILRLESGDIDLADALTELKSMPPVAESADDGQADDPDPEGEVEGEGVADDDESDEDTDPGTDGQADDPAPADDDDDLDADIAAAMELADSLL